MLFLCYSINYYNILKLLMSLTAKQLFYEISCELSKHISPAFILSTKTEKGNTQISERIIIQKIGAILDSMGLNYLEAG